MVRDVSHTYIKVGKVTFEHISLDNLQIPNDKNSQTWRDIEQRTLLTDVFALLVKLGK